MNKLEYALTERFLQLMDQKNLTLDNLIELENMPEVLNIIDDGNVRNEIRINSKSYGEFIVFVN